MSFIKNCAIAVLALGISATVATAAMRCDEHAKKASTTKASSCCATKTAKATKVSTSAEQCTTKKECTEAEKQACSTTMKTATVKNVKNTGSCCATKSNTVKTAAVQATPAATEVADGHATVKSASVAPRK